MRAGLPIAAGSTIFVTNPRPNMNGWNCSAASSSQISPSPSCSQRRAPTDSRSAAHAASPPPSVADRSVLWSDDGRNRVANATSDPAATTHRPGPPRRTTMASLPRVCRLFSSWSRSSPA
jgi:hypothetical protein